MMIHAVLPLLSQETVRWSFIFFICGTVLLIIFFKVVIGIVE
jgi:hypothetical protein